MTTPEKIAERRELFDQLIKTPSYIAFQSAWGVDQIIKAKKEAFNLTADHYERVIAEKDAEIARLKDLIARYELC